MIVVLSGRPGVGKTTCAEEIIARDVRAHMLTSITTRKARPSDIPEEYDYMPHATPFMRKKMGYRFLWTVEYPKRSGTYYGTETVRVINALRKEDDISIMILTPDIINILLSFAEQKDKAGHVFCFYMHVREEILAKRLRERGESNERISRILRETRSWDDDVFSCNSSPYRVIENEGPISNAVDEVLSIVNR